MANAKTDQELLRFWAEDFVKDIKEVVYNHLDEVNKDLAALAKELTGIKGQLATLQQEVNRLTRLRQPPTGDDIPF